jgi:hypothetical protein
MASPSNVRLWPGTVVYGPPFALCCGQQRLERRLQFPRRGQRFGVVWRTVGQRLDIRGGIWIGIFFSPLADSLKMCTERVSTCQNREIERKLQAGQFGWWYPWSSSRWRTESSRVCERHRPFRERASFCISLERQGGEIHNHISLAQSSLLG